MARRKSTKSPKRKREIQNVRTPKRVLSGQLKFESVRRTQRKPLYRALDYVEDRRRYLQKHRFPLTVYGTFAETEANFKRKDGRIYENKAFPRRFRDPFKTIICRRRKLRRRILFGKRKAGKGRTAMFFRRPIRTAFSNIVCKR